VERSEGTIMLHFFVKGISELRQWFRNPERVPVRSIYYCIYRHSNRNSGYLPQSVFMCSMYLSE